MEARPLGGRLLVCGGILVVVFCGIIVFFGVAVAEVPSVDVFDVLLSFFEGYAAGFFDVSRTGMVAGENEINVAVVSVGESSEVSDAAHDVLSRIERVFDAHVFGGGGHELHEPHGACVADGTRVEIAFDFDDGSDEGFGDAVDL